MMIALTWPDACFATACAVVVALFVLLEWLEWNDRRDRRRRHARLGKSRAQAFADLQITGASKARGDAMSPTWTPTTPTLGAPPTDVATKVREYFGVPKPLVKLTDAAPIFVADADAVAARARFPDATIVTLKDHDSLDAFTQRHPTARVWVRIGDQWK